MKYFIIVGEASGDLHGANLICSLKKVDANANFRFWGGDKMNAEASGLLVHYRDTAVMGLIEVVMKLRTILKNIDLCKKQILDFKPDVVVLIDYPGFNLRIAEFCKKNNFRTVYYISPKVWAWKENRAKKLEKFVDQLLLIFPFEVVYFKKWKVNALYVGNPLLDEIASFIPDKNFFLKNNLDSKPIIALLPGSRKHEISRMLPTMIEGVKKYAGYQFVIAGAPSVDKSFYEEYLTNEVKIVFDQTYDLLHHAVAGIVCSGTATLEAALFDVPQVCGYAGHPVTYLIGKMLVKIEHFSLVNLCLQRLCITELLQHQFNIQSVQHELELILPDGKNRNKMIADYAELRNLLGNAGASDKAAQLIFNR